MVGVYVPGVIPGGGVPHLVAPHGPHVRRSRSARARTITTRSWPSGTGGSIEHCRPRNSTASQLARIASGLPAAGRVAVKDRVKRSRAPAEDFRRDSDLFGEVVRNPEAQQRIRATIKRGFQTRKAEASLGRLLGELSDR